MMKPHIAHSYPTHMMAKIWRGSTPKTYVGGNLLLVMIIFTFIFLTGVPSLQFAKTFYPPIMANVVFAFNILGFIIILGALVVQTKYLEYSLVMMVVGLVCLTLVPFSLLHVCYVIVCHQTTIAAANLTRHRRAWLITIIVGSLLALAYMFAQSAASGTDARWWEPLSLYQIVWAGFAVVIIVFISVGFFWQVGLDIRRRTQRIRDLEAKVDLAAVQERNRIAREMHDIIAHSLTVIIAQADGGKFAGSKNPELALKTLDTIAGVGRTTLSEMRQLLSVLHEIDGPDRAFNATPGIAGIDDLIAETRRAGAQVNYTVTGKPKVVRESLGLNVFRIVQETLTNALKHGSKIIDLTIDWGEHEITIVTRNDLGSGLVDSAMGDAVGGRGLIGIKERAKLHGGTAQWGTQGSRWVVKATLSLGN